MVNSSAKSIELLNERKISPIHVTNARTIPYSTQNSTESTSCGKVGDSSHSNNKVSGA